MEVHVYGKQNCNLCKSAKKKTEVMLKKWGRSESCEVKLIDMDTVHGAAEGDFFDVFDIPSVFVMEDEWTITQRWDGKAPPSSELYSAIEAGLNSAAPQRGSLFS